MLEVARKTFFDDKSMLKALEIIRKEKASYQIARPSLVHGDYVPKHILVDGEGFEPCFGVQDVPFLFRASRPAPSIFNHFIIFSPKVKL